MPKLWKKLASRIIILKNAEFDQYIGLSQKAVKMIVNMSDFKFYKPDDKVDMSSGGIVWKGSLIIESGKDEKAESKEVDIYNPSDNAIYTAKSEDFVIVMHYPLTNHIDFKKSRIIEGQVILAFKD